VREIKFRAWDKKAKAMRVVWDIGWKGWDYPDESINYVKVEGDGTYELLESEVELMQFTGQKDKNGKEIYEGDILGFDNARTKNSQGEYGRVEVRFGEYDDSEIEYGSPGIGWYVVGFHGYLRLDGDNDKYYIGQNGEQEWSLERCTQWEVIGNIHENPEFLEEKK